MPLVFNAPSERPSGRFFLIDAIKAFACLLIVGHHLAFYGPMSDVVATVWPKLVGWLYDHGRLAVQFFLVCAGFLTAASLARFESLDGAQALRLAWRRYLRLAIPLMAALSFTVLVTEWVRPNFAHPSLSATPDWGQALAHMALLQHVLKIEALSAGIWYVAIDFQLYVMTLLSLVLVRACRAAQGVLSFHTMRYGLWLGLSCASWWGWNLQADLDDHGVYFFGAYGLGLLAWEARRYLECGGQCGEQVGEQRRGPVTLKGLRDTRWTVAKLWLVWLVLLSVAWWLEPRSRMAAAFGVAALLMAVPATWFSGQSMRTSAFWRGVVWLSGASYSVFLTHFGVSLLVSAAVTALRPDVLWANLLGMLTSFVLSVACGGLLHRFVERQSMSGWRWWLWAEVLMVSVVLTWWMNPGA